MSSFNTQVPPFLIQPSQALQKPMFCFIIRTIFTLCPFASAPFLNCSHKICEFPFFLGDLNGFVEHLEEYKISGKIYAANVMDAGLVKNQSVFQKAYDMGYAI